MARFPARAPWLLVAAAVMVVVGISAPSAGAAEPIVRGPYLQAATGDAVVVSWEWATPQAGVVEYRRVVDEHLAAGLLGRAGEQQRDAEIARRTLRATALIPARFHSLRLRGLAPGNRYRYRVTAGVVADGSAARGGGAGGGAAPDASAWYEFRAAPGIGQPFSFAVYGGSRGDRRKHREVAARIAADGRLAFVAHTGDMVSAAGDRLTWDREFFGPAGETLARLPLLSCPGRGESDAAGYRRALAWPEGPEPSSRHYSCQYGDAAFFVLDAADPAAPLTESSPQIAWLARALEQQPGAWRFVMVNPPLYSSGEAGSDMRLRALLRKRLTGRAHVVFSGGDRQYERTFVSPDRVLYVVTAGGGSPLGKRANPYRNEGSGAFVSAHHYVRVGVDGDRARIDVVGVNGAVLDRVEIKSAGHCVAGEPRVFTAAELKAENARAETERAARPPAAALMPGETAPAAGDANAPRETGGEPALSLEKSAALAEAAVGEGARAVELWRGDRDGRRVAEWRVARGALCWLVTVDEREGAVLSQARDGLLPSNLPAAALPRAVEVAAQAARVVPGARVSVVRLVAEGETCGLEVALIGPDAVPRRFRRSLADSALREEAPPPIGAGDEGF
ncbi:MAG: metallophosphoesterase family protein [Planctomycetes bacterium]|nr:metallophosphoesterase family protein [Planctomycetota bacterium]